MINEIRELLKDVKEKFDEAIEEIDSRLDQADNSKAYYKKCGEFYSDEEERRLEEIDQLAEAAVKNCRAIYSAWAKDKYNLPVNNLKVVALAGKVQVIEMEKGKIVYKGKVLFNPTWVILFREADKLVKKMGWEDHVFFEGFDAVGVPAKDGVQQIKLCIGS